MFGELYAVNYGMEVTHCIFDGLDPPVASGSKAKSGFTLANCVIARSLTSDLISRYITTMTAVFDLTRTGSFDLTHFNTQLCPSAMRWASRSIAATPTKAQTAAQPSESPRPSPTATVSSSPEPTSSPFPSPPATQTRFTELYSGLTTRLVSAAIWDVEVRDSVFVELSDPESGGALRVESLRVLASIIDCTFLNCSAAAGGGVDCSGMTIRLMGSCFSATSSSSRGTAVLLREGGGQAVMSRCTFTVCTGTDETTWGTIADDSGGPHICLELNFSKCALNEAGAGFVFASTQAVIGFSFQFGTVVGCSGLSGIHSRREIASPILSSHFCENIVPLYAGVLFCLSTGLAVNTSVFEGNTRDLLFDVSTGAPGYSITNCVFSDPLPEESIYLETRNNIVGTHTATQLFSFLNTELCPGGPPDATGTPERTQPPPPPTGTLEPTERQPRTEPGPTGIFTMEPWSRRQPPRMVWTTLLFQFLVSL
jgi:hypothetical protein